MGCIPIKLYLWILKLECQITVPCYNPLFFFFQPFKNIKHVVGWIWSVDSNLLDHGTDYVPSGRTFKALELMYFCLLVNHDFEICPIHNRVLFFQMPTTSSHQAVVHVLPSVWNVLLQFSW